MTDKDIDAALDKILDNVMDRPTCKETLRSLVSQAYEEAAQTVESDAPPAANAIRELKEPSAHTSS